MTITLYGHTLPVDNLDHANKIQARADEMDENGQDDALQQWLYAGAPLEPDQEEAN